jgi:hypothetical protein
MKKYLLPVIALIAAPTIHAQVANGDFDQWTKVDLFEHPKMDIEASSSNYETMLDAGILNVNRVDGPSGGAVHLESIDTGDKVYPAFFITGRVPGNGGENLVFGDGVPVNDANVTGVSLDIRYNTFAESPGFVIVQFKKNGTPIGPGNMGPGTMMVSLEGQAEWSNISIEFEEGFAETPDQCVVAIASSNLLSDDEPFTAGAFVEVDNIGFINSVDPFNGGDFETWTEVEPIWTPEGVLVEVDPFTPRYERTIDAFAGMFALALTTSVNGEETRTGKAIFAEGDIENPAPSIGITSNDQILSFVYKYEATNDVAIATATFYNTLDGLGTGTDQDGTLEVVHVKQIMLSANLGLDIGIGGLQPSNDEPSDTWTTINYNFRDELEMANVNATHMVLTFESSAWQGDNTPQNGSKLIVDNVMLDGALNSRGSILLATPKVTATPNPAAFRTTFTFNQPRTGFFRVLDSKGIQLDIKEFQSAKQIIYDLSNRKSGVYLFRFQHNGGVDVLRVVKI